MPSNELSCVELVELVTDYFEGVLPPVERTRFEEHLRGCGYCRFYLDQMRRTIQVLGKLTEETIPPAARDDLLNIFRNWKQS